VAEKVGCERQRQRRPLTQAIDANALDHIRPSGSPAVDAVDALGNTARACRLPLGITALPWELAVTLTGLLHGRPHDTSPGSEPHPRTREWVASPAPRLFALFARVSRTATTPVASDHQRERSSQRRATHNHSAPRPPPFNASRSQHRQHPFDRSVVRLPDHHARWRPHHHHACPSTRGSGSRRVPKHRAPHRTIGVLGRARAVAAFRPLDVVSLVLIAELAQWPVGATSGFGGTKSRRCLARVSA
jgi:hypothetical protein